MKIWLPYIRGGSGTDIYTARLADGLNAAGHEAVATPFSHKWQYYPSYLRRIEPPFSADAILANSWNGFAFRRSGVPLVVVVHLCVHDAALMPYKTYAQRAFHDIVVRGFETASFRAADAVIAVSRYTADKVREKFPGTEPIVIHNGVDTNFFFPAEKVATQHENKRFRLLFVGNLMRRKGADLLPKIMQRLGDGYELHYTSGLRLKNRLPDAPNMIPLGSLNPAGIRQAYQEADLLLFPTRLEGLPLSALEAMACGLPVIAFRASSLPEAVEDRVTGRLCNLEDIDCMADAVRELAGDRTQLHRMVRATRRIAVEKFDLERMTSKYLTLLNGLI